MHRERLHCNLLRRAFVAPCGLIMWVLLLVCMPISASFGEEQANPAETNRPKLPQIIDAQIHARLAAEEVSPAPMIDDARFLRRCTLDLAGRIPTTSEWQAFLADGAANKRQRAVDRLLDSPDFAFHQRNELDLLLLARYKSDSEWQKYLLEATRENRAWDRLFREIMLPEREVADSKGPAAFISERVKDLDDLTNDTAMLFFGVNISCAKCHDHPLVADWQQGHYFGLASFFNRTYRTKKGPLAEKFSGLLKFKTVSGEEHDARFMFLDGTAIEEPEDVRTEEQRKSDEEHIKQAMKEPDAESVPVPEFSPRAEFVKLALRPGEQNRFFARNIVNRTWARLMGRGFVMPLDQMHSENPPSHPELLDDLARDLVEHGYDLKRLIRGIVLSEAYARESRWVEEGEPPAQQLFARAAVRPLTPRQLSLSLVVASCNPDGLSGLVGEGDWAKRREELENQSRGFADHIAIPGEDFQVAVDEALLFSNSERVRNEFLGDGGDRLVGKLKTLEEFDDVIDTAYSSVLSRHPDDEERAAMRRYLSERESRRDEAVRQVVWALLASPEFRFNH